MHVTGSSSPSIVPQGVRASPPALPLVAALAGMLLAIQLAAGCNILIPPRTEEAPRELAVNEVAASFPAVAGTRDRWVAVGEDGAIGISEDGTKWTAAASGTRNFLRAVAHDGKRWVVVGDDGAIVTSEDGTKWTAAAWGARKNLWALAYDGKRWVAVGDDGAIGISEDGTKWTAAASGTGRGL